MLSANKLYQGGPDLLSENYEFIVQMSKRKGYLDLKRRIADCINLKENLNLIDTDLRIWRFADDKEKLVNACVEISKATDHPMTTEGEEDIEPNSGVEFPGESLEPYISTSSVLEDDTMLDGIIVVEYRDSVHEKFAFQFKKNQRIYIGKCEFCTQKRTLNYECKCKRVRYCNEACFEKDKRWHMPNCSA